MATPLRFDEFEIRAWRADRKSIAVIVHASPVSGMNRPELVPFDLEAQKRSQIDARATTALAIAVGRELASALLPTRVYGLFQAALREVTRTPGRGLRLRLVLDDELTNVPWEFLYRPEIVKDAHAGFLVSDPLISIVRGAPLTGLSLEFASAPRRLVFAGALWAGEDMWGARSEFEQIKDVISSRGVPVDPGTFVDAADAKRLQSTLSAGADIFHYIGHSDERAHEAILVTAMERDGAGIEAAVPAPQVAVRLSAAGVRLAVFNACNSAHYAFVHPFLTQRLPVLIGVSGVVFSDAAIAFSSRFYESLLVGFSVDEAVTHARLQLINSFGGKDRCDWGTYAVYLQSRDGVIFPARHSPAVVESQQAVRQARDATVSGVRSLLKQLDGDDYGVLLSDLASRGVLILGRFSETRLAVLTALKAALAAHPSGYAPILFTFDRPGERDLLESIATFAGLARFIVADISDASMVREELLKIVPNQPSVAVVPLIESGQQPYTGFAHIQRYPWVAAVVRYSDASSLLANLNEAVIQPAEAIVARQQIH
jgi:hypothetical protein